MLHPTLLSPLLLSILAVMAVVAADELKTKVQRRLRLLNSFQSGQADVRLVNLAKKHWVVKRYLLREEFENEVNVLTNLTRCAHVLQPSFILPATKEIGFKRIPEGDLSHFPMMRALVPWEIVDVARQIIKAVDSVHQEGYLHLDVKPENILFDGSKVWLIDFGLACKIRTMLPVRGIGTRRTMAPEMLLSAAAWMPITVATDWWSVGVTLFHLFARYYALDLGQHYQYYPYRVWEGPTCALDLIEWAHVSPALPPLVADLLFGDYGLLSYDHRLRHHSGAALLAHPLFAAADPY